MSNSPLIGEKKYDSETDVDSKYHTAGGMPFLTDLYNHFFATIRRCKDAPRSWQA